MPSLRLPLAKQQMLPALRKDVPQKRGCVFDELCENHMEIEVIAREVPPVTEEEFLAMTQSSVPVVYQDRSPNLDAGAMRRAVATRTQKPVPSMSDLNRTSKVSVFESMRNAFSD